jgi:hypothetical protein
MLNLINKIGTIMPIMTATVMIYGGFEISVKQKTNAKEIDLDSLCPKFPLNSRCQDYSLAESESKIYQLERNTFCAKFTFNSQCQKPPVEVIKINLDSSGDDDEWVRIEKQDNQVKLLHTTKVKDSLTSGVLNGALGLVPLPVPLPIEANKYNWEDHRVTRVTFQPDGCQTDSCILTGRDTLTLPEKANIYSGVLTVEYQEEELKRSLSLRIPADTEVETVDTITIEARR